MVIHYMSKNQKIFESDGRVIMQKILFYTKEHCSLCDDALGFLSMFQDDYTFDINIRDIHSKDEWLEQYQLLIPVIDINGEQLTCEQMSYENIERLIKKHCK